jgi:hypothetical protein
MFQQKHDGRLPFISNEDDLAEVFNLRDERLKSAEVDSGFVDDDLLRHVELQSSPEDDTKQDYLDVSADGDPLFIN